MTLHRLAAAAAIALAVPGLSLSAVRPERATPLPSANLLRNPGAEEGPASADNKVVAIPGWSTTGQMTADAYERGNILVPAPFPGSGKNFFVGGIGAIVGPKQKPVNTATQTVDVSAYASLIAAGKVKLRLGGMLGGYSGQDDYTALRAWFKDAKGKLIGKLDVIGPKDAERKGKTTLLARSGLATVPAGTVKVSVVIISFWVRGGGADGSADNISATLVRAT